MAKGRTNPGDVANLMVRCLLADASELLGGWTNADRERTLRYFDGRCAYTGVAYDPATFVWDHLLPHNQDACGLHVYGNLVPATRAANSAKGGTRACRLSTRAARPSGFLNCSSPQGSRTSKSTT